MHDALARGRAWLEAARDPTGAVGYRPGLVPRPEPTLLLAAAALEAPMGWLMDRELGWAGRLAPTVLRRQPGSAALQERELTQLLVRRSETGAATDDFDASLPAWSWVDGTAGWTEPTAHALLALRAMNAMDEPQATEAVLFLLDRQGADGGWNYGNPRMMGQALDSAPVATGWTLLALAGLQGAESSTERGLAWLEGWVAGLPTSHGLALLCLAQHALGRERQLAALLARQRPDGSWLGRCDLTAIACAAIAASAGEPCPLFPWGA